MEYPLKEYYIRYLTNVRRVSPSSVNHYLDAINWISKYLVGKGLLRDKLFEISDYETLEKLTDVLLNDSSFVEMNKRGHQMYTAGLNNYLRFAKGDEFESIGREIFLLDVPVEISGTVTTEISKWKRSGIIKEQSLKMAHYECEIDSYHKTFTAKRNGKQYMEGHHTIPLNRQASFASSLDVYANIVCLCPICHRLLHYGQNTDKIPLLNKIYYTRSERLAHSGIKLSSDDFIELAI